MTKSKLVAVVIANLALCAGVFAMSKGYVGESGSGSPLLWVCVLALALMKLASRRLR